MGIRIQKRIKLGKGFGINLSKRGASISYRGKRGSIGSKGYSIKTPIKGVSFRGGGCLLIFVIILSLFATSAFSQSCPISPFGNGKCLYATSIEIGRVGGFEAKPIIDTLKEGYRTYVRFTFTKVGSDSTGLAILARLYNALDSTSFQIERIGTNAQSIVRVAKIVFGAELNNYSDTWMKKPRYLEGKIMVDEKPFKIRIYEEEVLSNFFVFRIIGV